MSAISLTIFEDEPDALGKNVTVTTDGEFVVIHMQIWEEGLGSFDLAELKIHHPIAKKIGVAGVTIRQELRAVKEDTSGNT